MSRYTSELRERQAVATAQLVALDEQARAAGRALTAGERAAWDALDDELTRLAGSLDVTTQAAADAPQGRSLGGLNALAADLRDTCAIAVDAAAVEGRAMTTAELGAWRAADTQLRRVAAEIERLEHEARMVAREALESAGVAWSGVPGV